ncbi:MAG: peptidase M29 [Alphaproteobacteria bacterium]|nr:peptidase M29 [Alphaproteobacteria bacterium]
MLSERIEGKWIDAFARAFELSHVRPGDAVAILSETLSRQVNVHLSELALLRLRARPFHLVLPTPPQTVDIPIRSTGASVAIGGSEPVLKALCEGTMVVDLTVEGLMHAKELPRILKSGSRVLYVSNEHPEILERLGPDPALKPGFEDAVRRIKAASEMRVVSEAGSDLRIDLRRAAVGGGWGAVERPGQLDHWPSGVVVAFPRAGTVNGKLAMAPGDLNLTFKRAIERPIALRIENDYVVAVEGEGHDAELMRSYFAAWGDREAYATSHVGWGLNPRARWDAVALYDKGDFNGVEQRCFAGNFLYSTGANEFAKRYTLGHFDLPLRGHSVTLDGQAMIERGALCPIA